MREGLCRIIVPYSEVCWLYPMGGQGRAVREKPRTKTEQAREPTVRDEDARVCLARRLQVWYNATPQILQQRPYVGDGGVGLRRRGVRLEVQQKQTIMRMRAGAL